MDINAIQTALVEADIDGWLFYDFHDRDAIAARVLNMDRNRHSTRRWFYYIPARGEPRKLVHVIESGQCDHLPGRADTYLSWEQMHDLLRDILSSAKNIAMQYSPFNAIPYVSIVDAGTVELIKSFGVEVVSSADLVGRFEAFLTKTDFQSHQRAGAFVQEVKNRAFAEIGKKVRDDAYPTEVDIQLFIKDLFRQNKLVWDGDPIVAVNEHAANPHFEPSKENCFTMNEGDLVLLDLWAREEAPGSIYYDITWMGYIGAEVPDEFETLFQIVRTARDAAVDLVRERFDRGTTVCGWEVDRVCRKVIADAGYGDYFLHRTGHSIGEKVHGNGANIDNLETKDERTIIAGSCFSIEPGLYLPHKKMGFRSEIDVFVTDEGKVEVTGEIQDRIIPLLNP